MYEDILWHRINQKITEFLGGTKVSRLLVFVVMTLIVIVTVVVFIRHENSIDDSTICYKPIELISFDSANLEDDLIVTINNTKHYTNYEFSPAGMALDGILSLNESVDAVYGIYNDIKTLNEFSKEKALDIIIPKEAIGIDTTNISELETQFYNRNTVRMPVYKFYCWEKDYSYYSGTSVREGNILCSLDGTVFWYRWEIHDSVLGQLFDGFEGDLYCGQEYVQNLDWSTLD